MNLASSNHIQLQIHYTSITDQKHTYHVFRANHGPVDGLAVFRANREPRPSADGPGQPRIIRLMKNSLPCILKTTSWIQLFFLSRSPTCARSMPRMNRAGRFGGYACI